MTTRTHSNRYKRTPQRALPQEYPFTAIVGQDEMKLALLLNVIEPLIGGVLIMGHRGTGKSTAVRAIADLLPQIWKVIDCHYGCDPADEENLCTDCYERLCTEGKLGRARSAVPVVTLPLGATEDRVCGTIDIERALKEGVKSFEPGLLARANRGFLYVDEVNLLDDHLVDLLLDVAVTGHNTVEREGISLEHPARFVLVGSGNPEEGELRPQLVDRFGLCAEVQTLEDLRQRIEIVELREAFERDPERFRARMESGQHDLRRRLARARKLAGEVNVSKALLKKIAELCLQLRIDGHRGELTIVRAVRALAAFEGRRVASADDVRRVAPLALRHRLRRDPLEPSGDGGTRIEQALEKALSQSESGTSQKRNNVESARSADSNANKAGDASTERNDQTKRPSPPPRISEIPGQAVERLLNSAPTGQARKQAGRRQSRNGKSSYNSSCGRYSRAVISRTFESTIAIDATLRATAVGTTANQVFTNGKTGRPAAFFPLLPRPSSGDLRFKAFKRKQGTLYILAIDASGSMALNCIDRAKGALASLLKRAYINRDRVALVGFRGLEAEELLPPSQSMSRARRALDELLMGGSTPLASGLAHALNIARRGVSQSAERIVLLVFTDGRANVALRESETNNSKMRRTQILDELDELGAALKHAGVLTVIVDTRTRFTYGNEGRVLADHLRAQYMYLSSSSITDGHLVAQLC